MLTARRMGVRDLEWAAELEAQCFSDPWSKDALSDAFIDRNALYLAAELDGRPVGMCGLWQSLDEAEITNVAVSGPFRRRGVGHFLIENLLVWGSRLGVRDFYLEVRQGNEAALRLYRGCGFVQTGIRKGFYGRPAEDALILRRRLDAGGGGS